jgi:FkbM family methyltransferase
MAFPQSDTVIGRALAKYGEWAELEIRFLYRFLRSSSTVLDVGAYVGTHTLAFARVAAAVYAFEPQPAIFQLLKTNLAKNGVTNVTPIHAAVSRRQGVLALPRIDYLRAENFGDLTLRNGAAAAVNGNGNGNGSQEPETVPLVAIDDLGLSSCDLIKIDVEGMEPDVLHGGLNTLERLRPTIYAECVFLEPAWQCVKLMRAHAYRAFLKLTPAHNPHNVLGDLEDIFNGAMEAAVLLVPEERAEDPSSGIAEVEGLFPIASLDDLANRVVETTKIQKLRWEVVAEKEQVQRFAEALREEQEATARLNQTVAARSEEAERLGRELTAREQVASAEHAEAERLGRELTAREQAASAQQAEAERLARELTAREQAASAQQAEAERLAERVTAQEQEAAQVRLELAASRSALEASAGELELLREAVGEKTSVLAELRQRVAASAGDLERTRRELSAEVSRLEGELAHATRGTQSLSGDLAAMAAHAEGLRTELARARSDVQVLIASRSLRMTRPLRAIGSGLRRARRGRNDKGVSLPPVVAPSAGEPADAVAAAGRTLLASGLFDEAFYRRQCPELAASETPPVEHYLTTGAVRGLDPHPLFDTSFYVERNPDVAGVNPLLHYVALGAGQGRDPHPLFSTSWYAQQRMASARARAAVAAAVELTVSTAPRRRKAPTPRTGAATVYAFTSCCLNYVPKARLLASTLRQHNPGIRVCLLINEPVPEEALDELESFDEVAEIGDLAIPDGPRWLFKHTLVEVCTATKGFYMHELLRRPDCKAAFYFDPDIAVFDSIDPLLAELEQASILFTPHLTEPDATVEAIVDNEVSALKHGVFNLGFLGLKPSPVGLRIAEWWRDRLQHFCVADIPNGLFTDQRWMDLAPGFFPEIAVVRHPGCNVATWNLTHRRLEGDFKAGFTVNGRPLVFYHFSGFDSGAQEIMLNKYGGQMPAAHRLRRWYVAETQRMEHRALSAQPWAYGFFRNGDPITAEQRKLYRQRIDLQQAFPDPFDTSTPGAGYLAWFVSQMPGEPRAAAAGESHPNPLVDYLRSWRDRGAAPNPYFDPGFYLTQNPDVAASGEEPLTHFLRVGAREGRDPHPAFDTAFYRSQVPDLDFDNALLHYFTIGQAVGLRPSALFDPEADAAHVRALERWVEARVPVLLAIGHYGGGGTDKHVRELAALLGERARVLLVTPTLRRTIRLEPLGTSLDVRLEFDPVAQRDALTDLLRRLHVCRLHVHHALGNEHYLADLVAGLGLPFDFTVHDYYALAPNPRLTGDDDRFVGEDLQAHDAALLRTSLCTPPPRTRAAWQVAHEWLLVDADRVIAPSHDVARRLQRTFPGLRPVVAAHPEARRPGHVQAPRPDAGDGLRIAVLGELFPHKGLRVLVECARLNHARGGRLAFCLIGAPAGERAEVERRELERSGVTVTGPYDDADLPELLRRQSPDVIWYPAQWPETYSYTLSAGLASGLPLVVPSIGAFPERVAGRSWTWVQPWDLSAEEWLDFFQRIGEGSFATGRAVTAPDGLEAARTDFYDADYLRPSLASPTPWLAEPWTDARDDAPATSTPGHELESRLRLAEREMAESARAVRRIRDELDAEAARRQAVEQKLRASEARRRTAELELDEAAAQRHAIAVERRRAADRIQAMETTKFWKLRKVWFRLRRALGVPGPE